VARHRLWPRSSTRSSIPSQNWVCVTLKCRRPPGGWGAGSGARPHRGSVNHCPRHRSQQGARAPLGAGDARDGGPVVPTSLGEKLIGINAKSVNNGRCSSYGWSRSECRRRYSGIFWHSSSDRGYRRGGVVKRADAVERCALSRPETPDNRIPLLREHTVIAIAEEVIIIEADKIKSARSHSVIY
jgi:hypothetical protein